MSTYTASPRFPSSASAATHAHAAAPPRSRHTIHTPANSNPTYRSTIVVTPHSVSTVARSPAPIFICSDDATINPTKPSAPSPAAPAIHFVDADMPLTSSAVLFRAPEKPR